MQQQTVLLAAGSNSGGQLGLGHNIDAHTLQPCKTVGGGAIPPDDYIILDLSSGANHTVALLQSTVSDDVQIWVTGNGKEGQLGCQLDASITAFHRLDLHIDLGLDSISGIDAKDQWRPFLVKCGWDSTFMALRNLFDESQDDVLLVLGKNNDFGQLGVGQTKVLQGGVSRVLLRSNQRRDGTMRTLAIACGLRHTLVICSFDKDEEEDVTLNLFGWGAGRHGQLGHKTAVQWEPILIDEWKSNGKGSVILGAGKEHTIYHDESRIGTNDAESLHYLGSNRQGEQNVCDKVDGKVQEAGCTWNASIILQNGSIIGSGNNSRGQLGQLGIDSGGIAKVSPSQLTSGEEAAPVIKQIACGSEHVLALVEAQDRCSAQVWGWGWNEHGNLAQNDEQDRNEPVIIWPRKDDSTSRHRPIQIWAGCGTIFISMTNQD